MNSFNENHESDQLFYKGVNTFNNGQFYDAHEILEELWSEYKLHDRIFIQGLIQVSVAFYHLQNNNLNGTKSMLKKALKKIDCKNARISNLPITIKSLNDILITINLIKTNKEFDWSLIPKLLIKEDDR